jgi:hypothetical protein
MPNFHRFTIKAQEALQNAQEIAAKKNHGELKSLPFACRAFRRRAIARYSGAWSAPAST